MTGSEFSDQFDVLYNNITSNQAPGLNEYEKSVFLTKAQNELVKNYFLPQSNPKQAGFDGNQKRQMDFSLLMRSKGCTPIAKPSTSEESIYDPDDVYASSFDPRGRLYEMPEDLFIPINESLQFIVNDTSHGALRRSFRFQRQVIPLSYEEYTRLMSKPYKEPLKYQAWRLLINNSDNSKTGATSEYAGGKLAEIIAGHNDLAWLSDSPTHYMRYIIRYIRKPKPIIVAVLDGSGVTIGGKIGIEDYQRGSNNEILNPCELDESLHEEILQRAVELAKIAWTNNSQDNLEAVLQSGQRSE